MRFLGIDFGTKRIGVAVSDEEGKLAFPKMVLLNDINMFHRLEEFLTKEKVSEIVVGESTDFSGKLNPVSEAIEVFISEIKDRFKLPVQSQKEFLTSAEAHGRMGKESRNARPAVFEKPKDIDASAAALILQRYLDKKNKQKFKIYDKH